MADVAFAVCTHIVDLSGISIWHPVRWNYQNHENFSAFSPRYSDWVATGYTMTVTVNAMRYIIYLIGKCIFFTCSRLSLTMVGQLWRDTNVWYFSSHTISNLLVANCPLFYFPISLKFFGCNSAQWDLLYIAKPVGTGFDDCVSRPPPSIETPLRY